jgi:hypothetical protein
METINVDSIDVDSISNIDVKQSQLLDVIKKTPNTADTNFADDDLFKERIDKEIRYFDSSFKEWKKDFNSKFNGLESQNGKNIDSMKKSEISKKIIEFHFIKDIFSRKGKFEKFLPKNAVFLFVRYIPSKSDTCHIILVYDEHYDVRNLKIFRIVGNKITQIVNNDLALVNLTGAGRMGDMFDNIHIDNELFTLCFFHGGNWSHGEEFTFGKVGNTFKLQTGIGFSAKEIAHYDEKNEVQISISDYSIFFFKPMIDIKDMSYGETPDIISEFTLPANKAQKYFKFLNIEDGGNF